MPARAARGNHLRERSPTERERLAEEIAERMDGPVTALGLVFVLVVLADTLARPEGGLALAFEVTGWVLWAVFAAELVLRAVVAPSTSAFLGRNWWQLLFLALPFLRFTRILARLRVTRLARAGRVVSSAVRSSRSAKAALSSRLGWLATVTAIVVLSASQVLYQLVPFDSYGEALHDVALATVTGEPIGRESGVVEVALALYSVVVFATLAGSLGAYFLQALRG